MFDEEKQLNKALKQEKKSIFGFFIKRYRITYLILIAITALGLFSIFTLPREAEPEIKIPIATITTIYPGTTPSDIEETITDKIEAEIKNLDNLNRYTSTSGASISNIIVEFEAEADLKDSFQELRDAVNKAKGNIPKEADEPIISEVSINDIPIITYSLVGNFSEADLKKFADNLKNEFENIKNVSKIQILGDLEKEFLISVDQNKLANFNISLPQIINSVNRTNFDLPSGNIDIDGFSYNIKVKGKFIKIDELNNLVITTYNNTPIFIKDVANVSDTFKEQKTKSRLGFQNEEPKQAISLQIFKKTGGNILKIIKESKKTITKLQNNNTLPENLKIQKTNDNSVFIKEDLNRLSINGLQTMALIFIIIFLALGLQKSLIASLSVPIAFLITFAVLFIQGATLNSMVLFALVLSLGIMIDNSIVIMEGINEYINKHKKSVIDASILSVWSYKWPIISSTLTTVSAFAPMLLVSGIMGEYMAILPKTISATLLSSLFVSLIILPTLSHRIIKKYNNNKKNNKQGTFNCEYSIIKNFFYKTRTYGASLFYKLQKHYAKTLKRILPNKKLKIQIIIATWIIFIITASFPFIGLMKIEMFPKIDIEYFVVSIKLPIGSVIEKTEKIASQAEKIIAKIPELENYVTNIGTSTSLGLTGDRTATGPGADNSHLASITVNLINKKDRERKSFEIAESIRPALSKIQGAAITAEELSAGPPTGEPIEVRIKGENIQTLSYISQKIESALQEIKGIINVKNNIQDATGEFTFTIDKQKADYYGLDVSNIAFTLRSAIYGAKASVVNINGDDIDITVKYDKKSIKEVNDLENIILFTNQGKNIPLKEVANILLEPSILSINHRNGDKIVTVTANTEKETNLQYAIKQLNLKLKNINIPENFNITIGGEVEDIEKSYREIFYSMIIAIMLIVFILILQFNSFKQPFIIIFTLPLAIIGVILGLTIMRVSFSLPAFIGIVSLAGIVVNNAIILIDKINKNIKNGMDCDEAIIEGSVARMQPIFLTSATTIIGILPLYFANELWEGLSLTIMFGLLFSTILTLFIIPIMYSKLRTSNKF